MSIPSHVLLVNSSDALRTIQGLAAEGRIRFTDHAANGSMVERAATVGDVRCALVTATVARPQPNGVWRVEGGADLDGEGLAAVVLIDRGVVVVTVF